MQTLTCVGERLSLRDQRETSPCHAMASDLTISGGGGIREREPGDSDPNLVIRAP